MNEPVFIIVDLFCGAGGTTTGFVQAAIDGNHIAKVIACVNHDPKAIKSHWINHPEVKHFEEDIRTLDLTELVEVVRFQRSLYPNAALILWASLECTNFSKAKGGQPRDADSRTLADHLPRYIKAIDPDYVQIENVVEFMAWGPLDDNGKPISRKNGSDWMRWRNEIDALGYTNQWKELNSANYGAYTSRNRLFGCFAKDGMPIAWPEPTHAKNPSKMSMHGDLQKWKPVKEVLNFDDEGETIFARKKPLSDKTLERIYAGLIKYVAKGDTAFISKYFSGRPKGKVNSVDDPCPTNTTFGGNSLVQAKSFSDLSVDEPTGAITTIDHHALVQSVPFITQRNTGEPESKLVDVEGPARTLTGTGGNQDLVQAQFLLQTYAANSKGHNTFPVDQPGRTVTTRDSTQLVNPKFLTHYYGSGGQHSSVENPAPVIPTKARTALISPEYFIDNHYGNHGNAQNQSIEQPAGTILPTDKHRLVEAVPFIIDPQWSTRNGTPAKSIDAPSHSLLANSSTPQLVQPFIMPTNYDNTPKSVDEPLPTIQASRRHHYIVNPSHGGHCSSTDQPCPVIVARQDKAPLYVVVVENGPVAVEVYEDDTEIMIKIKQFMAVYCLVDIKMRMLRVIELLSIQGFPAGYKLEGNQSDQKKFIGNSVVPQVVKAWTEAMAMLIIDNRKTKVA